jgi:hypothetical protein
VKANFHITRILTLPVCEWSLSHLGYLILLNNMAGDVACPAQAGQLPTGGETQESFRTLLKATFVYAYFGRCGRGIEITRRLLFTNSKLHKSTVE